MKEAERIESLSQWYYEKELNFDRRLIYFRYKTLLPFLQGPKGLELGPAQGHMTQYLIKHFDQLTVVDGSKKHLETIPDAPTLTKINTLFETYHPTEKFNSIIMEHILEHIEHPVELLKKAKEWLTKTGLIFLGVPNGNSIHRLAAVKMGLLENPCQLNARDIAVGHRRVYTLNTLKTDIETAGLKVIQTGGVFFKPLSNQQIEQNWTEEMIQGFYELGKDFQENAAELYAICSM